MLTIRRSAERGTFDHGWLLTRHTFSFGQYRDPAHMGFGPLRVLNDDVVQPGQGFGEHPHKDMEIISYVVEGSLAHKDSTGGEGALVPGDVQAMTAGRGVRHSEFNGSSAAAARFLQVWIEPEREGLAPAYAQRRFSEEERTNALRLIVSGDGADGGGGALKINRDARIYATILRDGGAVSLDVEVGRGVWIQVVRGELTVSGEALVEGDGAAVTDEARVTLESNGLAEALVFEVEM